MDFFLWLLFRQASASHCVSGVKEVRCDRCDMAYGYRMSRQGAANCTGLRLWRSQATLEASAQALAQARATRDFQRQAELVPCPGCQWVSQALITGYARRHTLSRATVLTGTALALLLGVIGGVMLDIHAGRAMGLPDGVFVLAGVALGLLTPLWMWLGLRWRRRRVRPNRADGAPPTPPAGTPPPMLWEPSPDGVAGVWRTVAADHHLAWQPGQPLTFMLDQVAWPTVCCACGGVPGGVYKAPFVLRDAEYLGVPICRPCEGRFRLRWWLVAGLTYLGMLAVSAATWLLVGGLPGWRMTTAITAVVAMIFLGPVLAHAVCGRLASPYRWRVQDAARNAVRFQADDDTFNRLLWERIVGLDASADPWPGADEVAGGSPLGGR